MLEKYIVIRKTNVVIIGDDSYMFQGFKKHLRGCFLNYLRFDDWDKNIELLKEADCIINFSIAPDFSKKELPISDIIDVQIAEKIKDFNTHFIFISSRKVYGKSFECKEYKETDNTYGYDYYSVNKIKTEKALLNILGNKLTILRIPNLIGEPIDRKGYRTFIGWICDEYINKGSVTIQQNENSVKDFVTKEFLHKNICYFLKNKTSGIYNLSSGIGIPIKDVVKGYACRHIIISSKNNADSEQFILNNEKLKNLTKYSISEKDIKKQLRKYRIQLVKLRIKHLLFAGLKNIFQKSS